MNTQKIKAIFTNLLFVIGVILVVVGFVRGVSTTIKTLMFEDYPLDSYEETRCELELSPRAVPDKINIDESLSKEEREEKRQVCLSGLKQARKVKQVEDITYSVSFLISGLALTMIFKRFIM